ncbi:signal transduction histidine kinase [Catenulispora sp. EB89]|uniref:sensor histidine kinase n=1 Tax=Catenulispora sp. EB89 TaxID=3156257 RepID=UPI003510E33C
MSSSEGIAAAGHRARVPTLRVLMSALHCLFAALLVVGLLGAGTGARGVAAWVVGAVLGGVYAVGIGGVGGVGGIASDTGPAWSSRAGSSRAWSLGWLAAVTATWAALVVIAPSTAYVAFPLYFLVLHLLPRPWSLGVVAAITATVVATQATTSGGLTAAKVVGPCAGAAVALLTAYGYAGMYRESRRRQQLLEELVRAQAELAATQREAGRLAERQRLAREIHDTLAQGLSSIVLLARGAEHGLSAESAARVREIRETASSNLAEARRFVAGLTPPALDDSTLGEAVHRVVAGYPRVAFRLDGEPYALPMETEVALLRAAQEALANVERHAGAAHAAVTLAYHDDQVTLDVFDDGIGFDAAAAPDGRFGLHGMRERISQLGGALTIESAPGEGTAVVVALPARREDGRGGGTLKAGADHVGLGELVELVGRVELVELVGPVEPAASVLPRQAGHRTPETAETTETAEAAS